MKDMFIIPIFIPHEGCPFKCVFCNQNTITGFGQEIDEKYIRNTIETHLKTIPKNSKIEVSFYGGSFTGIPIEKQETYLSIAKEYFDNKKIEAIRISTRPDYINFDILDNLKKYSVSTIELGVQSMDDDVLAKSHRGHSSYDVINAVNMIKKYNFKLGLQMMIGLPEDNLSKIRNTMQKIILLKPDFVRIYPTLIIKGTYLERMYRDGIYKPFELGETIKICKELYINFLKNDIDVIRIGLQPTENINFNADIIDGPFHPALGQLVESEIVRDILEFIFRKNNINNVDLCIITNPKYLSTVIGQKKINKIMLEDKFNLKISFRKTDKIPLESIAIIFDNRVIRTSKYEYIRNKN